MTPGLLPGADRDLVTALNKKVKGKFEKIYLSTKVVKLEDTGHSVKVTLEGEEVENPVQEFEKVLISIGRTPNAKGLGLENTKVKVTDRGFIEVDAQQRTADSNIFAIGDIVGNPMLAHKASAEGRVAAEVIAGHTKAVFEPAAIPAVVFTDPELAWVGITEAEARDKGIDHKVAKYPWAASGRAMSIDRTEGLTKVIIDPKTERILGVGIVGAGAGELIAEGALAIEMAATANDLGMTIHPHPTLSETLKGAAEVYYGHATDIYRPKR
jgi:dihydrolipoamide dehydrogenase